LENFTKQGDSPVYLINFDLKSKIKFVKFYSKKGRPFSNSKYELMTDSEQVLWRKGEKW